ncbi:hypothetical protein [Xanthomonas hortorum]|uniref:hypothetical protein n=1 Tax=Xanthomonas hortorum TaxID=56454 RepID=UPI001F3AF6C0|nr:hypothetical protein [Xanthomonas hortorum]MCE4297230.1 hypothetical protein [Xanthomonas hortorum pv. vitians]MCE4366222.1 hypothetical protein [Xanthomonas hortorum pv. vitians]
MPPGKSWLTQKPTLSIMPNHADYWHVFKEPHQATEYNQNSKARFALTGDSRGMFYVGDTLNGVLWETVLRDVEPNRRLEVDVDVNQLRDMRAVRLALMEPALPLLDLRQPGLRGLGFGPNTDKAVEVARLIATPDHSATHGEIEAIRKELSGFGMPGMPCLAWVSRQHSGSNVFLCYDPPTKPDNWLIKDNVVALDDPRTGHDLIKKALEEAGFSWAPAYYTSAI